MKMRLYRKPGKFITTLGVVLITLACMPVWQAQAQGVGINNTSTPPDSTALLDVSSTTKGVLMSRMTTAQRNAIVHPALGLMIFNTDCHLFNVYDGTNWVDMVDNVAPGTPPAAPTAGTNTFSSTQIVWQWNAVSGAIGYKWSTSNTYSSAIDMGTNTSKTDTGLTCGGTSYTRYVWAYNGCGNSSATTLTQTTGICFTCGNAFTDSRDNQAYATVQIGTQCWFAQNLNYSTSGTNIPGALDQTNNDSVEKYCYGDDTANCTIYGGLYQWAEAVQYANGATNVSLSSPLLSGNVQGACPLGWHIPSDAEWCAMENVVEPGTDASCDIVGTENLSTGSDLKSSATWIYGPLTCPCNSSGFNALGAGFRQSNGTFIWIGGDGMLWSSTEFDGSDAWYRQLQSNFATVNRYNSIKNMGFSVRCVEN